ncbi:RagB/SusD family nutrient uptake outer membrane protein [Segatella bryantii]|uniref:RagB/SusD family nutrient uptake outer membrane protein n=1 Tax=Segatella bryantii TaxID=77095 RepID=UPI00242C5B0C|nr:RagB/SusD family nutrient uptake outer membrane protein [Segatella bryantii]
MKKLNQYIVVMYSSLLVTAGMTSCTSYLDKAPDSDISETEAFKDFTNFEGFTEELYNCIPEFEKGYWTNSWNWGEDEIQNVGIDYHMVYKIDQGDFWGWQSSHDSWQSGFMDRNSFDTNGDRFAHSLVPGCWYGIRKANLGLANIDYFVGTEEEKNLLLGQLYFFRGWFHFQLMKYFGGMPYIDRVLPADEEFHEPRLAYNVCADKAAADFRKAADLLPIDWDNTKVGSNSKGKNQLRVTKIAALAYLGKDLLYAGSPLMNKTVTGNASYNKEYCQKAADAFGELLALVESGATQFGLLNFKEYSNNFYTMGQDGKVPGQSVDGTVTEAIFRGPDYGDFNGTNWGLSKQFFACNADMNDGGVLTLPTANYVNYYGMANGLPLDDPESGFDKTHPWKGRDPRFYNDIRFDGEKLIKGDISQESDAASKAAIAANPMNSIRYADLQTGGRWRNEEKGSRTGYLLYKFIDNSCNKVDQGYGWAQHFNIHLPWMRLSDVYLMYAEAVAEATGNPNASDKAPLTAIQAVNKVRERAGVADLAAKNTATLDKFMSELRRERAVELSWEGHRFNDLRRWLLLDKAPYNIKTSQEFERVKCDPEHPENNEVSGFKEKTILVRNFTEKHYWLPLKISDCSIYPEFKQNPGW